MRKADRLYLSEALGVDLPDHFEAKAEWDRFSVEQLLRMPKRRLYLSCQQSRRGAACYREAAERIQPVWIPRVPVDPTDPRLYDPQAARRLLMMARRNPDRLEAGDLADWQTLIWCARSEDPVAFERALSEMSIERLGLTRPVRLDPALVRGVLRTH